MSRTAKFVIILLLGAITLVVSAAVNKAIPSDPDGREIVWKIITAVGLVLLLGWAIKSWAKNNKIKIKTPKAGKGGSSTFLKWIVFLALMGGAYLAWQQPEARSAVEQTAGDFSSWCRSLQAQPATTSRTVDIVVGESWTKWYYPTPGHDLSWKTGGPVWVQHTDEHCRVLEDGPGMTVGIPIGAPVRFRSRANAPVRVWMTFE